MICSGLRFHRGESSNIQAEEKPLLAKFFNLNPKKRTESLHDSFPIPRDMKDKKSVPLSND